MKNCIYFFTGTGNSLKLAQEIGAGLADCELRAIRHGMDLTVPSGCERIGFVYPVYYLGLPAMVTEFLKHAGFPVQKDTYYFAAATYGEFAGNSIPQIGQLLRQQEITLNYGTDLKMFSNCVTIYNMRRNVAEITEQSGRLAIPVVRSVCDRQVQPVRSFRKAVHFYHQLQIRRVSLISHNFSVNENCVSCGICRDICAARNISVNHGKPVFGDRCEHCTACIQHCPKQAINYKNRTQKRRRYTHPDIGYQRIASYYG